MALARLVCLHKAVRSCNETYLAVRHSCAVVAAEEVQAGVRAHDIPVDLLHHLRILRHGSPTLSNRQSWSTRASQDGAL